MLCNRCHNQIPDGSTFCPLCGNQLSNNPMSDDATRIAQPSRPNYQQQPNYQQPRPSQPNYGQPASQPYYAPAPKKNNTGLWVVVGVLAAALIGLGIWLLVDTLNDKGGVQQPPKDEQVVQGQTATDKAEQKRKDEQSSSDSQEEQQTSSQPEQQQTVAPAQTMSKSTQRSGTVVLKGKLNGDNVTFTLYPQGGDYYVGSFQNHKVGVTWNVEGYITSDRFDFTSTGLPRNWSFNASADGDSYAGTSSNGTVTYNMYLHFE